MSKPIALALLAATLLAGCGATRAAGAPAPLAGDDILEVVQGGVALPLAFDAPIPVADDLTATVRVQSVPGVRAVRTLRLALRGASGPVEDATISVGGHMRYMDHGSFTVLASSTGGGTYAATLPLVMAGEWELVISPTLGGLARGSLILDLTNYD